MTINMSAENCYLRMKLSPVGPDMVKMITGRVCNYPFEPKSTLVIKKVTMLISVADAESNCTSFEDYKHDEKAEKICFGLKDTEIDNSSKVFNGATKDNFEHSKTRKHHLDGGSIKNNSKFVNGDLDRESFIAFFCRD